MKVIPMVRDPRFFLRPGMSDNLLLDRLLTRDFFTQPIDLDGVILDAPRVSHFGPIREKLPASTSVLVDPQVYRLQRSSYSEHQGLQKLSYCPSEGPYTPDVFEDSDFLNRFVTKVLDLQGEANVTRFVAPAFFVESADSPWREVNTRLLKRTLAEVGPGIFSSLCGAFSFLTQSDNRGSLAKAVTSKGVEGVMVLASPLQSAKDSPSKLQGYLSLLGTLAGRQVEVIASRQPAFGLGCMALGLAGFDSGVGTTEGFDFASFTRSSKPREEGQKTGGARKPMVYLPQLLTSVPYSVAEAILNTSGVAGSFVCSQPCCRNSSKSVLQHSRDHFMHTRLNEVRILRSKPTQWRAEHFTQMLVASEQMAEKVVQAFPDIAPKTFRHLDIWARVFSDMSPMSRKAI